MSITSPRFEPSDARTSASALVEWLTAQQWPFHVAADLTEADVRRRIDAGIYDPPDSATYWIIAERDVDPVGLLHVTDLADLDQDGSPSFDLRLTIGARRRGIGTAAVRWITTELFTRYPHLHLITATTRADNIAMRTVLVRCNYVREGQFRQAWLANTGQRLDSLEYSILRTDWTNNTTTPVRRQADP